MRPLLFKVIFFSFMLFFAGVSCKTDKAIFGNHLINVIVGNLQSDSWVITSFIKSGKAETSEFSGYTFTFRNDGELIASNITENYVGSWRLSSCECESGDLENLELIIHFEGSNIFTSINNTWNFVSQTVVKIELFTKNGGNGSEDSLTFEQN